MELNLGIQDYLIIKKTGMIVRSFLINFFNGIELSSSSTNPYQN